MSLTWTGIRDLPSEEMRRKIEGAATGVILSHTTGRLSPAENGRTKEIISERQFDPNDFDDLSDKDSFRKKNVKDLIFDMIFEGEPNYILEVFHVWSSSIEVQGDKKRHTDTGKYYEVVITQLVEANLE
ncbi:hypothetical protein H7Y21_00720 [Arenimonas sp.]|nr:hypothetical protein [Candidatus Parcubacteria bacterium]